MTSETETESSMNSQFLIYDGGMGTTLEDEFKADISSALWSSAMLEDSSNGHDTLRALHTSFLNAGANLIQSCTYQCSFEGFAKQGHSRSGAISLMRKAVSLANEAIVSYQSSISSKKGKNKEEEEEVQRVGQCPKIVLALSCFGAILSPGQEYSGKYPAPLGHPAHSPSSSFSSASSSSTLPTESNPSVTSKARPTDATKEWLDTAEQELEQWHYNRLLVFASDASTWAKISYVAFETLPVSYEARAIRRAMTRLKRYLEDQSTPEERTTLHWPEWWVSFVFPDGNLPAATSLEEGDVSPSAIVKTLLEPLKMTLRANEGNEEIEAEIEIPTGVGINCTKMRYLPSIVKEMTSALRKIPRQPQEEQEDKRYLVLYPDGGLVYDPVTKTWHQDSVSAESKGLLNTESADPAREWASQLVDIARSAMSSNEEGSEKVWDGVILGGCCKASPAYIAELSKQSRSIL